MSPLVSFGVNTSVFSNINRNDGRSPVVPVIVILPLFGAALTKLSTFGSRIILLKVYLHSRDGLLFYCVLICDTKLIIVCKL
jgi:hypothetical protein